MEPVKIKKSKDDDVIYDLDLEKKIAGGISFGPSGIDIARHVEFNSEDTTVIRYYTGRKCNNMNGRYMLFDIPHASAGTFQVIDVKHSLKRIPSGLIIIQQTGIDRSTYPFTLKNELIGMICNSDSKNYWNENYIRLNFVKILGSTFPSRVLAILI